jgi:HSP20 family protein
MEGMRMSENEVTKSEKGEIESPEKEQNDFMTAFQKLENRIENMFQDMWGRGPGDKFPDMFSLPAMKGLPRMDIIDRKKEVVVKAELPGFEKDDLDVSITNNQLVIKAKTRSEEKEEKGDYLRREISENEVYRSTLLPADVDDSKVKTSYRNGLLKLTIPKKKKSSRKSIKVK